MIKDAQSAWRDERRQLQRRLVDAEFGRLGAEARAAQAERALSEAQVRLVQLEHDAAASRAEAEALRASTSWRLTRPLRGIGRVVARR